MNDLLLKKPRDYKYHLTLAAALCAVSLGIFFRFYHINQRLFWQDEVFVTYRVSGYTEQDLGREIHEGQVYSFQDLEKYLHPARYSRGLLAVIKTAWEYPHIPPLYESLLWCWIKIFGDSIATIRSFSAFLSLFAFPLVIWLCWELFRSYKIGWIAAILIAVSPYQVMYAQEARNYSIWCVMILFSSAALLRAVRLGSAKAWALYAGSLALGLYSHGFFFFVAAAHALYVLLLERNRIKKMAFSCLAALLFFLPQLFLIILHYKRITIAQSWFFHPVSIERLVKEFSIGWAFLFIEPQLASNFVRKLNLSGIANAAVDTISYALVIFGALTLLFLWKRASRKQAMFVSAIFLLNFLGLLLPDLLFGGIRVTTSRYLMASFLTVQIGVAFFVYYLMGRESRTKKIAAIFLLMAVFLMGAVSCLWQSRRGSHMNFGSDERVYREAAAYLDAHEGSLIIRDERGPTFLRKLFIIYFYLKNPSATFFTQLPKEGPFLIDFDRYHKSLLTIHTRTGSLPSSTREWVESSGTYKLAPVGPKHWQTGRERIYEIRKTHA